MCWVIATIGPVPYNGLMKKLLWMARCLGCPFVGLFYFCNIGNDPLTMSAYWIPSTYFVDGDGNNLRRRPFGHHAKRIQPNPVLTEWVAEASILDRLSSLVSA